MMYNEVIPTELILGAAVFKTSPEVSYHWGHQKELLNYLTVGKSYSQINAFDVFDTVGGFKNDAYKKCFKIDGEGEENKNWKQYPLVWFVKPSMTYSTAEHGIYSVPNARIIIALNNSNLHELNDTREKNSFPKLVPIANRLLDHFKKAQNIRFEDQKNPIFGFDKVPNYSTTDHKDNEAIDIWDAIVIEAKLLINTNCLTLKENNCGCRENQ